MAQGLRTALKPDEEVHDIALLEGVDEEIVRRLYQDAMKDLGVRMQVPDYMPVIARKRVRAKLRAARRRAES